ncbi:MAG TPA: bifunctional (p)ppGpp synthetase/guanosine-3',5'-bis(diphosphate) 3'-pyrophosphohydrolase [Ktedonobacterales bacterium]|nr:bifunctional (p)ppGpp synthetase/guanosine-3',5'-bis(diphosphate) 3'-pyrophosphohydrolase [Ktedonobacterales bacterium]
MSTVRRKEHQQAERAPATGALKVLLDECQRYMSARDLELVQHAYDLAEEAHRGVTRQSGEPYIEHPLAVAKILADMRIDAQGIAAALLHDVVEDTRFTLDDIRGQFGAGIAAIVDGVTKFNAFEAKKAGPGQSALRLITPAREGAEPGRAEEKASVEDGEGANPGEDSANAAEGGPRRRPVPEDEEHRKRRVRDSHIKQQAETVRKLLLAMAEDPRVVVVKLADRLHNMRTLEAMSPVQQQTKAREVREIYAPLAGRLGMGLVKTELEDLAFKYLEPKKYQWLKEQVAEKREQREEYVERVCQILREEMRAAGIKADISGRPKHLYSIYVKIERLGVDISEIHDLIAFRILVDTVEDCYRALGHIHMLWRPKDGRIKDYIAQPKQNGYQSLHTTVFCLDNRLAEIQIRTHEMHRTAELGVATHWYYKESGGSSLPRKEMLAWVEQLREWQKELSLGATEFVETVKDDLFKDQIFVFTPKGDVRELPVGSTPLDFAYRIHSEVGDHCAGARIITDTEGFVTRMVPLDYELKNGEIVAIITNKNAHPTRDWLAFARSKHAREKILHYLKITERDIDMQIGLEQLDRELRLLGARGTVALTEDEKTWLFDAFSEGSWDDLLAAIGREKLRQHTVALRLVEHLREEQQARETPTDREARVAAEDSAVLAALPAAPAEQKRATGLLVGGMAGLLTQLASCCSPLPGDEVVGFTSRGRGVVVHRADCKNLKRFKERNPERLIEVSWESLPQERYLAPIIVTAQDRPGLVRDVAAAVGEFGVNMTAVGATTVPSARKASITATLEIESLDQLNHIIARLKKMKDVVNVERDLR